MVGTLCCLFGVAFPNPTPFLNSFSRPDYFLVSGRRKEKAAGEAGKHQYSDVAGIAASAGHRPGDGGENFADAQVIWRVQERRWFARDSRARAEAPRENAQVLDRRKSCSSEVAARYSEAGCGQACHATG